MTFSHSQLTAYAHEYLQGGNQVPIGALDDPFFKSECRRLWGPEPSKAEQIKYLENLTRRLGKALKPLYGPRGGLPKQHRRLEWQYHMALGELETLQQAQ